MRSSLAEVDQFADLVARWTLAAVERRPASFGALLRSLPGADPGYVADSLAQISARSDLSLAVRTRATALLFEAQGTSRAPTSVPPQVPIPHPLDCYWPTDASTLRALSQALERLTPPGEMIVYLAWPNSYGHARARLPDRDHLLLERDPVRAASHRLRDGLHEVLVSDVLRDELPTIQAQTLIADPPWYPEESRAFLWAAARLAKPGAHVLFALPPVGTRPRIEDERREILDWAARCGLEIRDLKQGALGYVTPPFERAALAARGLSGTPDLWRRGDLLVLEAERTTLPSRPVVRDENWHGMLLCDLPIRVRITNERPDGPISPQQLLRSIVDGDVLPTVSRRSALRRQARLWTSRNRVFASADPRLLAAVIEASAQKVDVEEAAAQSLGRELSADEREAVRTTVDRLIRLARREREEHGLA